MQCVRIDALELEPAVGFLLACQIRVPGSQRTRLWRLRDPLARDLRAALQHALGIAFVDHSVLEPLDQTPAARAAIRMMPLVAPDRPPVERYRAPIGRRVPCQEKSTIPCGGIEKQRLARLARAAARIV